LRISTKLSKSIRGLEARSAKSGLEIDSGLILIYNSVRCFSPLSEYRSIIEATSFLTGQKMPNSEPATKSVSYNSVLQLEHFSNPEFQSVVRDVFAHWVPHHDNYPVGNEVAKVWEITQAIRGLRDFGAMRADAEVVGVAAGHEHTVFYLTDHVARVFATDLYATNEAWFEAARGMLSEPEKYATAGMRWNPKRLAVQHMNALDLRYEDDVFDGIFSCGSIEHFGSLENVAQAAREMGRVLKPGGIMTLSTEFRISGPTGLGIPGAIIFTPEMLVDTIVKPSGLEMVDEFEDATSPATVDLAYPLEEAISQGTRKQSIALTQEGYVWTSVSLCLRKPG